MKKITMFYLSTCPYCAQAKRAISELTGGNPAYAQLEIDMVEESQHPDIADQYDYYHVPSMFVDGQKLYEAEPGESYEECREHIRKVMDAAVSG